MLPDSPLPEAPRPSLIDDASFRSVAHSLRGVQTARVRFMATQPDYEAEFVALLLALDISVESESISRIAPMPKQRFSFQFKGRHATVTVAPNLPLRG